jgi:anaerobic magnesium-protoporphyrin IX monomethyl ester cyclase
MLVVPTFSYQYEYPRFLSLSDFPTGLAYIASALKSAGHEVIGVNPNNDPGHSSQRRMLESHLISALEEKAPDIVGLGGLCTDYPFLRDSLSIIRKHAKSLPIVLGGGMVNNDPDFAMSDLKPDFCVAGEAEEVLVRLIAHIEKGQEDIATIPNIGFWAGSTPTFTKRDYCYPDLDGRCLPDYDEFGVMKMLDDYSIVTRYLYRYSREFPRPMTIVTARSCPFSCSFCVHKRGPRYRARSIDNIVKEIRYHYERFHFNVLIILDELFAVKKDRLREFCRALIKGRKEEGWDFDWCFQTHASAAFQAEDLGLAREAGCYLFGYGLESASPSVLKSMNKKTKPSQIIETIDRAREARVGFGGNFIFGDVAENATTIGETMDFFARYCQDQHVYFALVRPYPGSRLFDTCLEKGIIGNRKHFYDHIDESLLNMTSIQDNLWYQWIRAMMILAGNYWWVKTAEVISCKKEQQEMTSPAMRFLGQFFCRITLRCPHCEMVLSYLEPSPAQPPEKQRTLSGACARFLKSIRTACVRERGHILSYIIDRFMPRLVRNDLLLLLSPMKGDQKMQPLWFVTGCRHCNRRFRVTSDALPESD